MDGTVLVADDDKTIRKVLTQALTRSGCRVHATSSLTTLMRWVAEGKGDAVITDVMMPDGNGLEMLPKIAQDRPELPVIVISAQNTIMTAIQATEANAFDYLPKPFDLPDLMKRCAKALELKRPRVQSEQQMLPQGEESHDLPLVGDTPVMQVLYRDVARLIHSDLPILIHGESGTGKSLICRILHNNSDRRALPFVTVSESELTSIDGPAQIISRAKGGTVLFEHVSDFSSECQGRIVRMIDLVTDQSPRFMATLQEEPSSYLDRGDLRNDLYYRLAGGSISLPSLRERVDDILPLAQHFLTKGDRDGAFRIDITEEASALMRKYSWPGNVRQLENTVNRLGLLAQDRRIEANDVAGILRDQPAAELIRSNPKSDKLAWDVERHLKRYFDLHGDVLPPSGLYQRILHEVEKPLVEIALAETRGNQAKCADLLGINRNTLRKKISELDIDVKRRKVLS